MPAISEPALSDPAFYAGDPFPAYAWLRDNDPVHWHEAGDFWALSRHDDVTAVSRDPATYVSSRGVLLVDRDRPILAAQSILYLDPPTHVRYRRIVAPVFTGKAVLGVEQRIRALTRELFDGVDADGEIDAVDALAAPLPLLVIAELLGVPASDRDRFRIWSDAAISAATELTDENMTLAVELLGYFNEALEDRRTHPRADLLTSLLDAQVDGERLTVEELLGFRMTLLVAGNETTRTGIAGGLLALHEHPEQRTALVDDPAAGTTAVEEILRWVTPVQLFARTAARDVELRGKTLREGDFVVLLYAAANRDEAAFGATAAEFDVRRDVGSHLAFGTGEHFCLGASLARLEMRVFFEELLSRYPSYAVTRPVEFVPSTLVRCPAALPISLRG
jgi:cytochrome P450